LTFPVVAFQAWDAVGWAGNAVFTWRVVLQWVSSERARRSLVSPAFWGWSLVGTILLLAYAVHRRDPVFVLGLLVNGVASARNLWMMRPRPGAEPVQGSVVWPVVVGVVAFTLITIQEWASDRGLVRFDASTVLLLCGFAGQILWSGRFVVQWWQSERLGQSVLSPTFFRMSIAGSLLLFAYAVARGDWVNMAGYALNPIPYARNLVLIARTRRADAKAAAPR
jgi:lipid-A-disaccharide synthase-like uncharacterized protein